MVQVIADFLNAVSNILSASVTIAVAVPFTLLLAALIHYRRYNR